MIPLRYFVILSLFVSLSVTASAQIKAYTETVNISWQNVQKIKTGENEYYKTLFFTGAVYDETFGDLPLLYQSIELPLPQFKASVAIENAVYSPLSEEESEIIAATGYAASDVQAWTKIRTAQKKSYAGIFLLPIRLNPATGLYEKLTHADIELYLDIDETRASSPQTRAYKSNSVMSSGQLYKICLNTTGIHKITYNDLLAMGMNVSSINPQHIRIYGTGNGALPASNNGFRYDDLFENAIYIEGEQDGVFNENDFILFYGLSPHTWSYNATEKRFDHTIHGYSDANCYFITADHGQGKRLQTQASNIAAPTHTVTTFNDYLYHEKDSLSLIHTGSEWFGETFDIQTEHNFSFSLPGVVTGSLVRLKTSVAARSFNASSFNVTANGNASTILISAVPTSYTSDYARAASDTLSFAAGAATVNVNVKYNKPTNNSLGWLNFLQLNYTRQLSLNVPQMNFRSAETTGTGFVSEFVLSNANASVRIWDVTHPFEPKYQEYTLAGSQLRFVMPTDTLKTFVAYNGTGFHTPQFVGLVPNQNLHGLGQYEFIIVSHPSFVSEAQRLALAHFNNSGLSSVVVSTEQIYNEFSSGVRDATAIRDFVKMFYDRAQNASEMPKYLLLFGDGSYDNKNRTADNTAFIPTYQSANSLQPTASYVTDDYFGLFDAGEGQNSDGSIDIGIGRFPVKTIEEARAAVNKSIIYLTKQNILESQSGTTCSPFGGGISNYDDWRNVICFIADDEDGNLHVSQAEHLSGIVDTTDRRYNIDKIYYDAYLQQTNAGGQRYPEVNDAITSRVEKGALIINYTGHGGEEGWGHERVLTVPMINDFKNTYNLPVFVTATCEFSRFDDPKRTSAGELVFLNPMGGGVALLSTTRLAFANTNFSLNKSFYNYALTKINNEYPSLGDLMKLSKNAIGNISSIRNFVLLGDPALKMVYPEYNVVTTTVPDTMRAMSEVTISGYIDDGNGNVLTDFNGVIYPTVFDKPSYVNTLANDPASAVFTFKLQKNILFKGKASVVNGYFSFSFIVPRDIAYTYGNGKISYYAEDGTRDAAGYHDNFKIGGFDENFTPDNEGPVIKLYMNDTNFVTGGITDHNPVLLALLSDDNGINTTGNGIGHDITCVLDENTNHVIVLNDYYEADLDSYKQGRVVYPFYNLDLGIHTLTLKVWDVHNNSSEAYLEFFVTDAEELAIKHLINYPNPFTDLTNFVFEHNQTCESLTVEISIYNVTGDLVKVISRDIISSGFKTEPVTWNGTGEGGQRLAPGIYIYKLDVKNCDGLSAEKTEKLILLK